MRTRSESRRSRGRLLGLALAAALVVGALVSVPPTGARTLGTLTVTVSGSGTVTGMGISCPPDCAESNLSHVTLTASPGPLQVFKEVLLQLRRGKKSLASKHVNRLRPGVRLVRLLVPKRTPKGNARLRVLLEDRAGNGRILTRAVKLPKPKRVEVSRRR